MDYERCNRYTAVLRMATPTISLTCAVTLNGRDNNDQPTISPTSYTFNVNENAALDTTVGSSLPGQDEDLGQELSYRIVSGNEAGHFRMNSCDGQLSVDQDKVLNHEATPQYTFSVRVEDNGTPAKHVMATVVVNINDLNEPPVFVSQSFRIDEHAAVGTTTTPAIVTANDQDAGQSLLWSITRNDDDVFAIASTTGRLTLRADLLNYEIKSEYNIEVTVTDGSLKDVKNFVIHVNNINDRPVVKAAGFQVEELGVANQHLTGQRWPVGKLVASDEDPGTLLTYSIVSGDTNGAFSIDPATGQVTATPSKLDFEVIPQYSLVIGATDGGIVGDTTPERGTAVMLVELLNINERPTIPAQVCGDGVHFALLRDHTRS